MTEFIVELTAATAADADRIGPKAANLADLASAGLPTPGGLCLSAQADHAQIAALGLALLTAVRACWAALWTTTARRSMENHACSPADTAMAVLIQPLVDARASGGGLSETAAGGMLISATWGLGSTIAQGEVVPDRIVLSRQGFVRKIEAGRKDHRESCRHGAASALQAVPSELVEAPCLDAAQAVTLGRMMRKAETVIGGAVEIEWALDHAGFKLLQARSLAIPLVRGVLEPPGRVPGGAEVAGDGVAAIVRGMAGGVGASSSPSRFPAARSSACAGSRASRSPRTRAASFPRRRCSRPYA